MNVRDRRPPTSDARRRDPVASRSRRGAAHWALPAPVIEPRIDVLIPSVRHAELAVVLAGLAAQDDPPFRVIVSDQSEDGLVTDPAVMAMLRVLHAQGRGIAVHRHLPRRGLAEQRQFLVEQSTAPRLLCLDDDVWLEPGALERLDAALDELDCGFVGYAVQGLSYLEEPRPAERSSFEPWSSGVERERIRPGEPAFERWPLHNAANLAHEAAELGLADDDRLPYRVAWIGGCVLYRRESLLAAGGYDFWSRLPAEHAGEDVVAQWRVMERDGGAGILPSGAVHLESPTTVVDRRMNAVDVVLGDPADPRLASASRS